MSNNYNNRPHAVAYGTDVSNLSDRELDRLMEGCRAEIAQRASEKKAKREEWVSAKLLRACAHPTCTWIVRGELTILSIYRRNMGINIATSLPVHGDKYDENVGIAVAYAKAMGEEVPDYI